MVDALVDICNLCIKGYYGPLTQQDSRLPMELLH